MSDHREEAEKLAGEHGAGDRGSCWRAEAPVCEWAKRVVAIEAVLERAEAEGWQKGVEAVRRVVNTMCGGALVPPTEEK